MKNSIFKCGLFLVLLLPIIQAQVESVIDRTAGDNSGAAFQCYVCENCAEVNEYTVTKPGVRCTKSTTQGAHGKKTISRGIYLMDKDIECLEEAGQEICYCNRNFCNSAFTNKALVLPLIGLSAMHLFL